VQRDRTHDPAFASSVDLLDRSTAQGARGIFLRFVLVVLGINFVVGGFVIAFDIWSSVRQTRKELETAARHAQRVAGQLSNAEPGLAPDQVMHRASDLTGMPMALLDLHGNLLAFTDPQMVAGVQAVYAGTPGPGVRFAIREDLGDVSGAWLLQPFGANAQLLVVAPHSVEDEGRIEYLTVSAGVLALGEGFSLMTMLLLANWMLRRPLSRLVNDLTSALSRDIQRRQVAEQRAVAARIEAERHLQFRNNLLDASDQVGIVATGSDGTIEIFNRAAHRILGFDESEVVGSMTLDDLRRRTDGVSLPGADDARTLAVDAGEEVLVDKRGAAHLVAMNESPILDAQGRMRGRVAVFIDVTERKRLEANLRFNELQLMHSARLASLGEMATGVAHELSQPLNNIGLLASRIARRLDDPSPDVGFLQEKVSKIEGQVRRASRIIQQLRAFGRPSVHQLSLFPVARPVEAVLDLIRQQLADRGISLQVDIPADLPHACADESQVEQVLINLLNNARDALGERQGSPETPCIKVWAEARQPDGSTGSEVHLCVGDNGPGIPPEIASRIFEPFFTTKEVGKGTGLGLSISYALVRGFGGRIEVQSSPRGWTVFRVVMKTDVENATKESIHVTVDDPAG